MTHIAGLINDDSLAQKSSILHSFIIGTIPLLESFIFKSNRIFGLEYRISKLKSGTDFERFFMSIGDPAFFENTKIRLKNLG